MTETQISQTIEALWSRWYESGDNDGARGWWLTTHRLKLVILRLLSREKVRELAWHIACEHDDAEDDDDEEGGTL